MTAFLGEGGGSHHAELAPFHPLPLLNGAAMKQAVNREAVVLPWVYVEAIHSLPAWLLIGTWGGHTHDR
jgi:hypothetical protein